MSRVIEPNKRHFSLDTTPFPFIICCLICLEDENKSRSFSCPRQKYYHLFEKHVKVKQDFQDPESKPQKEYDKRINEELEILEQLSILNHKGVFVK